MAIRTSEEIMANLNEILGDNNSDEVLSFMTDLRDTLGGQNDAQRISELETQLQEQDASWRKKYRDAFLSGADESFEEEQNKRPRKYEDLFTSK